MENDTVYTAERTEKILEIIRSQNSVSVKYLADYFNVSGATIRTDLTKLENSGDIIRTHGGAMLKTSLHHEQQINERFNADKKIMIANRALEFIHDGDTVLIDTGTTMLYLAQALARSSFSKVRIFTNDIEIVRILEEKEDFEIHLLGGKIRNSFHYCYGHQIIEELKKYNFEKMFLATAAISTTHGLTVSNDELAQVKTAMIKSSKNIILLADSSKINRIDFQTFADIGEVDVLIMDSGITPSYEKKLKEHISKIILAE
ncbi:MAG: DeoR/GlpR transcriptional regulator [Eubacterium sp.]|jgi:Transcriptional regulators of sugar metabolism|nr:DeoR/GlpR transcriptional regulator [Eubacterium sp.]